MNWLIRAGVSILEGMFVVGSAGTVLVLLLSAIEDFHTLTDRTPHD